MNLYRNNFDLIRLVAALQVAFMHAAEHLGAPQIVVHALGYVPGVPVFFFVSGYLVFASFERSSSLPNFAWRRALRIYPALWFCFLITILAVVGTGYLALDDLFTGEMLVWSAAQLSIAQFYNPEALRGFGTGVVNGSLWTISVELQFYLLTPIFAWLLGRRNWAWAIAIAVFAGCNILAMRMGAETTLEKLFQVSFVPWVYMFLFGAWLSIQKHWAEKVIATPLWMIAGLFVAAHGVSALASLPQWGNAVNPPIYIAMALLALKLAFLRPHWADRLLRGNDISYGVYIYHMVVINVLIHLGLSGPGMVFPAVAATVVLALLSWFTIEKPLLKRKSTMINQSA